jgi:PAS domain-containing protein
LIKRLLESAKSTMDAKPKPSQGAAETSECIEDAMDAETDGGAAVGVPAVSDIDMESVFQLFDTIQAEISEDLFDAIQNSFPVPWAVCSTAGVIVKCNTAFSNYFRSAGRLIGASIGKLIVDEDAAPALS